MLQTLTTYIDEKGGADWLSSFLGGGTRFCGLFWVVEADCGGGVVIDGSHVLVGFDVAALSTMVVVVVVGRQTMCIVCLLFVMPN